MTLQQETRLVVTIEPATLDRMSLQDDLSTNMVAGSSGLDAELDDEDEDEQDEFVPSWAERRNSPPRIGTVA